MSRLSLASFPFVHLRTWVVGVNVLVLLSGCAGGSAPNSAASQTGPTTASPTSSVSVPAASATPSASPVYKPADATGKAQNVPVPVMPELAKENSEAGLEAFIGYYYAVGNYANETGDISVLGTLSTPECKACAYFQKASTDSYNNGRWMVGGHMDVPAMEVEWDSRTTSTVVRVQVIQDAISYRNADGSEGRAPEAATNDAFVHVATFEAGWKVVDTGVLR
ncbi:DUF6318 family protein [Arthrobacter sp. Rue61a]|uniref:DUF6318 family protein n=1 Tax=Arthrobacter sp. Rue61a TaxID=1118963 RepID=UPI00027DF479|nr:DUF6318 family protein [Arthrobacter sp. Rue61a]AFR30793.1 putative lipoprotein [Arthrobacter sp. Rue61a]